MLLFLTVTSLALQASVADTSPFRALPLPAPNRVRGASGAPGPDYWQQRADYVIRATLDTAGSLLQGSERIHYENHSPDTLRFLWVQIEQNIFTKNSVTYALNQPPFTSRVARCSTSPARDSSAGSRSSAFGPPAGSSGARSTE